MMEAILRFNEEAAYSRELFLIGLDSELLFDSLHFEGLKVIDPLLFFVSKNLLYANLISF